MMQSTPPKGSIIHHPEIATSRMRRCTVAVLALALIGSAASCAPPGAATSAYDKAVLADAPVAYFALSGASDEKDLTGHQHRVDHQETAGQTAAPNGDPVALFNGSDSYVSIASALDLSITATGQLTWEAWIRPTSLEFANAPSGYTDWMGKCDSYSPTCEWEARMYTATNSQKRCSRLSAYAFNPTAGEGSGADWQPSCGAISAGRWLHVVGEYQTRETPVECNSAYPGTINIWVNGVPWSAVDHRPTGCMSQYKVLPKAGPSSLLIGTMARDLWFSGAIGKVAIYDSLLTQDQITGHFRTMTGTGPAGSCKETCVAQKVS